VKIYGVSLPPEKSAAWDLALRSTPRKKWFVCGQNGINGSVTETKLDTYPLILGQLFDF